MVTVGVEPIRRRKNLLPVRCASRREPFLSCHTSMVMVVVGDGDSNGDDVDNWGYGRDIGVIMVQGLWW